MDLEKELDKIKDEEIKQLTRECLDRAPPHFWYKPASSTGKYHDPKENEVGGLILHSKRVCKAGEILIDAWPIPVQADVVRSACTLHDVCKYGDGYSATKYTQSNHPSIGGRFIRKVAGEKYAREKVNAISNAIASHMGRWGPTFENTPENLIVHLADVLATRMYQEEK